MNVDTTSPDGARTIGFTMECGLLVSIYRKETVQIKAFFDSVPVDLARYPMTVKDAHAFGIALTLLTKD